MTDTAVAEAATTETTGAEAKDTQSAPAVAADTLLTGKEEGGVQEGEAKADDQKAEDKPADGSDGKKPEVPEDYEFSFSEGMEVDADTLGDLKGVAKELGLTQEQAQKLADLGVKQSERWVSAQQKVMEDAEKAWVDTVKTDKEIGGDKLAENLAIAKGALDKFGSPELSAFLKESRLGNHPEIIRFMHKVGKAIADDSVVPGGRQTNQQPARFYDNSDHT